MSGKMAIKPIKPFRVQALMKEEEAEKKWKILETAIGIRSGFLNSVFNCFHVPLDEIYKRNSSMLFYEELYRTAYNLVLHKYGSLLYEGVCKCFLSHSQTVCSDMLKVVDSNLLSALCVAWEENKTTITKVDDVVIYMNRTFIVHQKLVSAYCKGVTIFREVVVHNPVFREKMRRFLLESILAERNGQIVDTETIKGVLNMLIELGVDGERVYETDFEEFFLSATKSFYREEYLLYSAQFSCPDYIRKVETRFLEETQRVNRYLSKTTEPKLRAILNCELISDHAESLVQMEQSGCSHMMKENQIDSLKGINAMSMSSTMVCNCICV